MTREIAQVPTPAGSFRAVVVDGVVCRAAFMPGLERVREARRAHDALDAYFRGELDALDAVPAAAPGSAFQRRVWEALRSIPVGSMRTYGELASEIGAPGAARAVGRANATNPIGVIVPCHRVVAAAGGLGGYAGGVERKAFLLAHEGAVPAGARALRAMSGGRAATTARA